MPARPMTVAVIMPVRDDRPHFRQALASIAAVDPPPDQVIVVVDGPSAAAAEAARAAGCRVIERAASGGPAAARNTGARHATTDALLFVDADVALHADLIARVREMLPNADAVVGCYDQDPPERNFFSQYKHLLQRYVHLRARAEGSTFWGACGAIHRRVFFDAGGFDERFAVPSVEDIEFGYRLKAARRRIAFAPALQVTHLKRWTLTSLVSSDVFRRALPWTWLLLRRSSIEPDLNLDYRSRAAGLLALVLFASIAASMAWPWSLAAAFASAVLLAWIDRPLWRFFAGVRGAWFATRAVAWHWVYYAYSTLAFGAGVLSYPFRGRRLVHPAGARLIDAQAAAPAGESVEQ